MSGGHTPGPWAMIDNGIWDISVKADGTVCHINNKGDWFPRGELIAGRSQDRMLADARLITAAPELLRELRHLARCLRPWIEAGHSVPGITTLNGAFAAIAKATGEQA